MTDREFWTVFALIWVYSVMVWLTASMVYERSNKHLATTFLLSVFWIVFYPIAYLFLLLEKVVTKWRP